jgi:hypothetical protein
MKLDRGELEALFDTEEPFDRAAWERAQRQYDPCELAPEFQDVLYRRTWRGVRDFATAHRVLAPLDLSRSDLIERLDGSFRERGFAPLLEDLSPIARKTLGILHSLGGVLTFDGLRLACHELFLEVGHEEGEAFHEALEVLDLLDERALIAIGMAAEGVRVPREYGEDADPEDPCAFLTREVGELLDAAPRE